MRFRCFRFAFGLLAVQALLLVQTTTTGTATATATGTSNSIATTTTTTHQHDTPLVVVRRRLQGGATPVLATAPTTREEDGSSSSSSSSSSGIGRDQQFPVLATAPVEDREEDRDAIIMPTLMVTTAPEEEEEDEFEAEEEAIVAREQQLQLEESSNIEQEQEQQEEQQEEQEQQTPVLATRPPEQDNPDTQAQDSTTTTTTTTTEQEQEEAKEDQEFVDETTVLVARESDQIENESGMVQVGKEDDPISILRCGTVTPEPETMEAMERDFSEWQASRNYEEDKSKDDSKDNSSGDEADQVVVPVVWHSVLTNAGNQGATEYQILQNINVLNDAFDGTGFVFRLQEITVSQNTFWWSAGYFAQGELDMKANLRQGGCETLNIYSTGTLQFLGWAIYPFFCGGSDLTIDGVVINYNTLPGGDFVPYDLGYVLVHEVGHWLGLFHTFEGGCLAPDDFVLDTAQEAFPKFGCPIDLDLDTCDDFLKDDVTNYMNYVDDDCMDHFTNGQIDRMQNQWKKYRKPDPVYKAPSPSPTTQSYPGCFAKTSTVSVQDQGPTEMAKLQLRNLVMTADGGYQPIYAFAHQNNKTGGKNNGREFLRIHTKPSAVTTTPLEVTAEHLVYITDKPYPVRADSIQVGDQLVTVQREQTAVVTKIETVHREDGLYAPLTPDGTIVVDGIVASCYVALQNNNNRDEEDGQYVTLYAWGMSTGLSQHAMAHILLAPVRMACIGVSPQICQGFNQEGLAYFVQIGFALTKFISSQHHPPRIQLLFSLLFCMIFGPLYVLEWILGPTLSAFFVMAGVLVFSARSLGIAKTRRQHKEDAKAKQL